MDGILAVELRRVSRVELRVCREHGDAIDSGAPFGLEGVQLVMGDEPATAALDRPEAVWQPTTP